MVRALRLLRHLLAAGRDILREEKKERGGRQRSDNDVKKSPDLGMIGIIVARASSPGATAGVNLTSHHCSANSHPVRGWNMPQWAQERPLCSLQQVQRHYVLCWVFSPHHCTYLSFIKMHLMVCCLHTKRRNSAF